MQLVATYTFSIRLCLPVKLITSLIIFSFLSRTAKGTSQHDNKHRCTTETYLQYGCPPADVQPFWPTTNEEMVRFSARLIIGRKGDLRDRTIRRYKRVWMALFPNEEMPLTQKGLPIDFLFMTLATPAQGFPG